MMGALTDAQRAWRREQRGRLLEQRRAMPSAERRSLGERVIANLDRAIAERDVAVLGIYWPIKREIDLLPWATALAARRPLKLALPVVTTPKAPLDYCVWGPGDRVTRGFWDIPVPETQIPVFPDVVIAPLVGFLRLLAAWLWRRLFRPNPCRAACAAFRLWYRVRRFRNAGFYARGPRYFHEFHSN